MDIIAHNALKDSKHHQSILDDTSRFTESSMPACLQIIDFQK
ncbi:hypothetical protein K710_0337 [Streptococcus iniae SF1]|nr:hypothetical protein [Streptococcus iniae]AGM98139.1 hypothetical protein K710_0337 [Streptococcus iniae SF1]EKB53329.1 hypothetical protein A0G_1164 [Streptococcus iniae 9117]ESR09595.1 hypothetical protein IUSA1_06045 [Streptococcus iniae IUSA1]